MPAKPRIKVMRHTQKPPSFPSTARALRFFRGGALRQSVIERGASSCLDALPGLGGGCVASVSGQQSPVFMMCDWRQRSSSQHCCPFDEMAKRAPLRDRQNLSDGERGEAICEGQLARGPDDHEANGTDCKTDPNGGAIFRKPGVCFLFLFHMSPSGVGHRTDTEFREDQIKRPC